MKYDRIHTIAKFSHVKFTRFRYTFKRWTLCLSMLYVGIKCFIVNLFHTHAIFTRYITMHLLRVFTCMFRRFKFIFFDVFPSIQTPVPLYWTSRYFFKSALGLPRTLGESQSIVDACVPSPPVPHFNRRSCEACFKPANDKLYLHCPMMLGIEANIIISMSEGKAFN